jgi:alkanesulfonate monooxygenase SsuD/methylene tetrahydromethanopterin reductase-like flavin-dependent oxidoreductase (luciferase family)
MTAIGYVIRPEHPPEALPDLARRVEAAGFDELWMWEDCFWAGGIATAGAALAATSRLRVGVGIFPAPMRNPVTLAMEIAGLARVHPGRVLPGVGHGVGEWMRQIGALPRSQLGLLEEVIAAVRALLAGEELTVQGRYVQLDRVQLEHLPPEPPPVSAGVRRPRSLAISGRVADGTILAEPAPVEYVEWARSHIAATRPHRLTVYAWYAMDADGAAAREAVREVAAGQFRRGGPHVDALGLPALGDGAPPDEWIDRLGVVVGTPEECAAGIRALAAAGAEAIPLCSPHPKPPAEDIDRLGRELLPLLRL